MEHVGGKNSIVEVVTSGISDDNKEYQLVGVSRKNVTVSPVLSVVPHPSAFNPLQIENTQGKFQKVPKSKI